MLTTNRTAFMSRATTAARPCATTCRGEGKGMTENETTRWAHFPLSLRDWLVGVMVAAGAVATALGWVG